MLNKPAIFPALIAVVAILALSSSTTAWSAPEQSTNTGLFREAAEEVTLAYSPDLVKDGGVIRLARQDDDTFVTRGVLLSPPQKAPFPFDNAVLSWNAVAPPGTRLVFKLRVGNADDFSPWFTMGSWSTNGGASFRGQANAWGDVDVDTLELSKWATTFQYRVEFTTDDPAASPQLGSVSIVYADMSTPLAGPAPFVAEGWSRDLDVPRYSQMEEDASVARVICSPTSLAMVLNYWGENETVREVYQGVRDAQARIYGNWPLNTAYAGVLGYDAYVDRFYSVEQLQNEIAQGRPVIISIRFSARQLDNSPIPSTTGHLIVVRGFSPQGDVIVNDPIAPSSSSVRLVYKRDQLAQVWLRNAGGIVYLVRPR